MSIKTAGLYRAAYARPSARISRPSASVFCTSTVFPERVFTMSPGFIARPPGIFSVVGRMLTRLSGSFSLAAARMAARTSAPPVISAFMCSMFSAGFSEMPPVSNVTVLPTRTTGRSSFLRAPRYSRMMNFGGSWLPRATPSNAPMPNFSMSFCSRIFNATPVSFAMAFASWAILVGVITLDGWLQRSRTKMVASAVAVPRRTPSERSLNSALSRANSVMESTSSPDPRSLRYSVN